jgi:hypothetical protein
VCVLYSGHCTNRPSCKHGEPVVRCIHDARDDILRTAVYDIRCSDGTTPGESLRRKGPVKSEVHAIASLERCVDVMHLTQGQVRESYRVNTACDISEHMRYKNILSLENIQELFLP